MSALTKRGRKPKPYVTSWGEVVAGLRRREHDGRWIVADGRTFVESDERTTVARARDMLDAGTADALVARQERNRLHNRIGIDWAEVAREIRTRPQWVAERTGIEQIAYLRDLKPPTPLPTLDAVRTFWADNAKCSTLQMKKVRRAFDDFRAVTAVAGLREITRDAVQRYERAVVARGDSGKQQSHLISGIRRVLRFYAKKKAEGDALVAALTNKRAGAMLRPRGSPLNRPSTSLTGMVRTGWEGVGEASWGRTWKPWRDG